MEEILPKILRLRTGGPKPVTHTYVRLRDQSEGTAQVEGEEIRTNAGLYAQVVGGQLDLGVLYLATSWQGGISFSHMPWVESEFFEAKGIPGYTLPTPEELAALLLA